jgi:hypothetical protein
MKLTFTTFVICAVTVGAASAQPFTASPQLGLHGAKIGKALDLPRCSDPGERTDAMSALPVPHNGSDTTCWFAANNELPATGVVIVRTSNSAHAADAYLRQDFKVDIQHSKVVGVSVMSAGGAEQLMKALKAQYGEPTTQREESGAGANFRPATAEWRLDDGIVNFSGGAPGYAVAVAEIEAVEWYNRPVPNAGGAGLGPSVIASPVGERNHETRAVATLTVIRAAGISMHRLRSILEIDEKFLEKIAPEDRQPLRKLQDHYSSAVRGAEFALTPAGKRILGIAR